MEQRKNTTDDRNKKNPAIVACFKCGARAETWKMAHVGYNAYECRECLFGKKKGAQWK